MVVVVLLIGFALLADFVFEAVLLMEFEVVVDYCLGLLLVLLL